MTIVIMEILVCLILAGLLGGVIGWFLHRMRSDPARRAADRMVENLQEAENRILDLKAESRIHAARAEVLEKELRTRAIAEQALQNDMSSLRARLEAAATSIETAVRERDDAAEELAGVREQLIGASAQIEEARAKLAEQERTVAGMQRTITELEQTRAISVTALAEKSREIQRLLGRISEEETRHQTAMMERSAELAEAFERASRLDEELGSVRSALEGREREIGQLSDQILELEERLRQASAPPPGDDREGNGTAQPAGDAAVLPSDDLKRISGIGPKMEQLLHRLGVHTFRQVALWSEEDIKRVDAQLQKFRGRIQREGWVERAREEFSKKYGKPPEEA